MTEQFVDLFSINHLTDRLSEKVKVFHNSVQVHASHPTYMPLPMLKEHCKKITAIHSFLLEINEYRELPGDIRKEVDRCQLIVEAQYAKRKLAKKGK